MSKILFLSDFHLGTPDYHSSRDRELLICDILDTYHDITELFLVGDVFDFWFEYKTAVPKGYYRLFGQLAKFADSGVKIHFFTGNHDMWIGDLFEKEFNAEIHRSPIEIEREGKKMFIGHGDGLGPGDHKYKFIKIFFASPICQWIFRWLHPDIGITLANYFSYRSRYSQNHGPEVYLGNSREWLYIFAKNFLLKKPIDYFIFGHRHLPIYTFIENTKSKYINLGDWLEYNTYAVYENQQLSLKKYNSSLSDHDFDPNQMSNSNRTT